MARRFVLLLRGVNVGGVTVRSADLRSTLEDAGFTDVRTVLASGNAVVGSDRSETEVRGAAQDALHRRYEREVPVVVRTLDDLTGIVRASPSPATPPRTTATSCSPPMRVTRAR
ncbi:DUF1697 domain-containing protein [Litorihabitans aurantiacus]|uniref:DUF1697 domain-containing protein n=1 Tax=Litorihabitans aurantiacus TaxID=1930061 RepID=A0AA37UIS1_9MICO|nr:DUF1697 domain-containing protein [Litorihabitans aurantiacus]GMA31254.1 hypothetical protein GCM10025875_12460 [Litorihabitans aurantiacus]